MRHIAAVFTIHKLQRNQKYLEICAGTVSKMLSSQKIERNLNPAFNLRHVLGRFVFSW